MSSVVLLTVEIELPNELSDELQDTFAEDLTEELNIERLKAIIKHWVRKLSGDNCHVSIDVE